MDNKVIIKLTCPYCGGKLVIKKKEDVTSMKLICPKNGCGKGFRIIFEVTKKPQAYRIITDWQEGIPTKNEKTTYKKKIHDEEECDIGEQNKKTIYGKKDHNKTPHNVCNDIDVEEDDDIFKPKIHHSLRERIYLTYITWFGLKNQKFQLHEGTTTIGRYDEDEKSDIMISGDKTMSRRSVAIIIEDVNGIFDYKLKVFNATNKVKVNDRSIKKGAEVYLAFGDIIMLGNSKFKFDNH